MLILPHYLRRQRPAYSGSGGGVGPFAWEPSSVGDWAQISGSNLSAVDPSPTREGNSGPSSKIAAWTSACVDVSRSIIYVFLAGGHLDYGGNEVNKIFLETNTPVWSEIFASSSNAIITTDQVYYSDGNPSPRHHFYGAFYDPYFGTLGRLLSIAGAYYSSSGAETNNFAVFNLDTNTYDANGDHPDISNDITIGGTNSPFAICMNPNNGDVYAWGGNFVIVRWNQSSNTWTDLTSTATGIASWIYGRKSASAWDSSRNRILMIGGDVPSNGTYTPSTNTFSEITLTGTAASAVSALSEAGMTYIPSRDSFLIKNGTSGGTVYEIDASTFSCSIFSTTGGSSIPAVANSSNGLYNKFLYLPRLKCCILIPEHTSGIWALKVE